MDDATWAALALALTVLGGVYTWWAFRHRGAAAGLRGLAITLLPAAAWLTGTLEMFTRVGRVVSGWASGLVLSPAVWAGITVAGTALLLWLVAAGLDRWRPVESRPSRRERQLGTGHTDGGHNDGLPSSAPGAGVDDDFADIEELLRRKGIE